MYSMHASLCMIIQYLKVYVVHTFCVSHCSNKFMTYTMNCDTVDFLWDVTKKKIKVALDNFGIRWLRNSQWMECARMDLKIPYCLKMISVGMSARLFQVATKNGCLTYCTVQRVKKLASLKSKSELCS